MVLVYHGRLEQLTRELQEVRGTLNQRYFEILGRERAERIRTTAERILEPQSFFDNVDEMSHYFDEDFPPNTSNKMGLGTLSSLEIKANGEVKERKIRTAPFFYISEDGFRHSHSAEFTEQQLASYVHELEYWTEWFLVVLV